MKLRKTSNIIQKCDFLSDIHIFIRMKNKKITIRISENQLRMICDQVILEEKTKSELIREMIDKQVQICRKRLIDGKK